MLHADSESMEAAVNGSQRLLAASTSKRLASVYHAVAQAVVGR